MAKVRLLYNEPHALPLDQGPSASSRDTSLGPYRLAKILFNYGPHALPLGQTGWQGQPWALLDSVVIKEDDYLQLCLVLLGVSFVSS